MVCLILLHLFLPPLHLILQKEAGLTKLFRLKVNFYNSKHISSSDIEEKLKGWTIHPSSFLRHNQTDFSDGYSSFQNGICLYTDGSKSDGGVGAAFCVYINNRLIHQWSTKLRKENSVFQAELLALSEAVQYTIDMFPSLNIKIFVDNKASLLASSDPKTKIPLARKIFINLFNNPNIKLKWVKAHTGNTGNEMADSLAKLVSTQPIDPTILQYPRSYVKSSLIQDMIQKWQYSWDNSETGRIIYKILPTVKLTPIGWNRSEIIFFTGHGPFRKNLHRFHLSATPFCGCGDIGDPIHYATSCMFTTDFHMRAPSPNLIEEWMKSVSRCKGSRQKIRNLIDFLHEYEHLLKPDA